MRIAKVNTQSCTSFHGLTIDKRALQKLSEKSEQYRLTLNKVGEELEPIKDYVLALDENLGIKSIHKVGKEDCNIWKNLVFEMNNAGHRYERVESDGATETIYTGFYPDIPYTLTNLWEKNTNKKDQYEEFKKMDDLSRATILTKMLYKRNLEKKSVEQEHLKTISRREEQRQIAIDENKKIIALYGIDMEHKTFWDKIKRNIYKLI